MHNITVLFIGSEETAKLLGNKGTVSDIELRDYGKGDRMITVIRPITYPDKIKTLIQSIALSDYAIIELERIDKYLAEIIISLDLLKIKGSFIYSVNNQVLIDELKPLIKGTFLESYDFKLIKGNEDVASLKQELISLESKTGDDTLVLIDHAFNVSNVGLVVLGMLRSGELSARDQCVLQPGRKLIQVKSIQCMDKDLKSIKAPARVGLSLKNCQLDDIARGSIIVKNEKPELLKIKGKFYKNNYYKDNLSKDEQVLLINSLNSSQGLIKELGSELTIELQKPLVIIEPRTLLLNPNSKGLRVIGYLTT